MTESVEPVGPKAVITRITSTKPKDPKRVEAGKRLGQISKQIREQKMRQRIESEQGRSYSGYSGYGYLVGLAGLVLAALSVYYARAQHKRESLVKSGGSSGKTVRITKDPVVSGGPELDSLG